MKNIKIAEYGRDSVALVFDHGLPELTPSAKN
jgi:hypothetical protein